MRNRWIRAGGIAGIAGILAALATVPMVGSSPKSSAPVAELTHYAIQHQDRLRLIGLLVVLSAALLAWFAATFSWVLLDRERGSPLGFLAALLSAGMVTLLALDGILEVALSFTGHRGPGPDSGLSVIYLLENGIVMPGAYGLFTAAFLVVVAVAAFRGLVVRAWVGYLSLVLALLSAAAGCVALTTIDGGTSSAVSFSPAIATVVVTMIVAIGLLREHGSEHPVLPGLVEGAGS
jgi:hypothetical protein